MTICGARRHHLAPAFDALDEIESLESALSAYLLESEISLLNRAASHIPARVTMGTYRRLRFSPALARATGGAFTRPPPSFSKATASSAPCSRAVNPASLLSEKPPVGSLT